MAGINGGWGPHVYTAAKFAVVGITKSLAHELHHHGIRVNAIAPGGTDTPMICARPAPSTPQWRHGWYLLAHTLPHNPIRVGALCSGGECSQQAHPRMIHTEPFPPPSLPLCLGPATWLHGNPDVSAAQTLGAAFPGKALTAEDMAQAALWLSCDLAGGVNGHVLAVDGGDAPSALRCSVYTPPLPLRTRRS